MDDDQTIRQLQVGDEFGFAGQIGEVPSALATVRRIAATAVLDWPRPGGRMPQWIAFAVIGLIVWRAIYAIQHARRDPTASVSRWTDPWML